MSYDSDFQVRVHRWGVDVTGALPVDALTHLMKMARCEDGMACANIARAGGYSIAIARDDASLEEWSRMLGVPVRLS